MKRTIISTFILLGLVLFMSVQCASTKGKVVLTNGTTVNITGTYKGTNGEVTIQFILKHESGNTVTGIMQAKMPPSKSFVKEGTIKGELKDEEGKVIFDIIVSPLSPKVKPKEIKFTVLDSGAILKGTIAGVPWTFKKK